MKTGKKMILASAAMALVAGTVSLNGFAASIISFNGPAGEAYIGKFIKGIKATAKLKGYEIEVYYAGPDDALRARNAGLMMVEAARAKEASGGKGFNVVAVTYPQSYGGYGLSINAFKEAIAGSGLNIIGEVDEGFGQANGYKGAAKMIAKLKDQGIHFVYGMDDAILTGAIKAFEEANYRMGEDVIAVGTVCNGDRQLIEEGKQYGTTLQSPLHEGQLAIKLVEEYLKNGKLRNYINFTPNPAVTKSTMETTALKGYDGKAYTIEELCSGAWAG